jgi:hypothetical protein
VRGEPVGLARAETHGLWLPPSREPAAEDALAGELVPAWWESASPSRRAHSHLSSLSRHRAFSLSSFFSFFLFPAK